VQRFAARAPQARLLAYQPNRGKGYAVRYGMLRARGERILFSDADLATPIEELEKLEPYLEQGYAIAIGSRPLRESQLVVRQPLYREMAGRAFNKLVQLLAVRGIHDTQCGVQALHARGGASGLLALSAGRLQLRFRGALLRAAAGLCDC
jgi:dolichyl-phosphate beta-glucosyltransferase